MSSVADALDNLSLSLCSESHLPGLLGLPHSAGSQDTRLPGGQRPEPGSGGCQAGLGVHRNGERQPLRVDGSRPRLAQVPAGGAAS